MSTTIVSQDEVRGNAWTIEAIKRGVYVVVIHLATGQAYTLNRGYWPLDERIQLPVGYAPPYVEDWDNYPPNRPEWANEVQGDWKAYWLY